MWPLLADSLREAPPTVSFGAMTEAIRRLDERSFQSFVLGGVFKAPGAVDELVHGTRSLARTVAIEVRTQEKLLTLLGLNPFSKQSAATVAFQRLVSDAAAYRDEVVSVLESFWSSGFGETWALLEPQMNDLAQEMRTAAARRSFAAFAATRNLPVTMENGRLVTTKGAARTPVKGAAGVYLLPSAFNTARLWASYADARGRVRFFLPVLDQTLSLTGAAPVDPALVFRALGDTTRYAIASSIARTSMTSVELARAFSVSKPTISHHVQLLRSAGLIDDTPGENGVRLSLNRRVLERASMAAAREMFSEDSTAPVVKRSRRANQAVATSSDSMEQE
jgi:DNA-binding transcriptional ArsR family regulator